jgi:hypothetical protein
MGIIAIIPIVLFYGTGILRKVRFSRASTSHTLTDHAARLSNRPTLITRLGQSSSSRWEVSL